MSKLRPRVKTGGSKTRKPIKKLRVVPSRWRRFKICRTTVTATTRKIAGTWHIILPDTKAPKLNRRQKIKRK